MILVPPFPAYQSINAASAIEVIPSSLRLASITKTVLNNLVGFRLGALLHYQRFASGTNGSGHFMTYKHPNSKSLCLLVRVTETGGTSSDTVTFKVGSGSTMTATIYGAGEYLILGSWGSSDSGFQEVVYSVSSNVKIDSVVVFDVPRGSLDLSSGDVGVEGGISPSSGFDEAQVIAASDIDTIYDAQLSQREYQRHHAITWCLLSPFSTYSTIYDAPAIDSYTVTFKVAGKQYKASETTRKYRAYFYSYVSKGTYDLRVSVNYTTNYDLTGLSNTSYAWQSIDSIKLLTSGCTVQIAMKTSGSDGYIGAFCLIEHG